MNEEAVVVAVSKLELEPGDILVLRFKEPIMQEGRARAGRLLHQLTKQHRCQAVILDNDAEFQIIRRPPYQPMSLWLARLRLWWATRHAHDPKFP